eukprot:m.29795 g.29795  ORF g.29795 m.29795 type:complete len:109 (+) comp9600_c1_seq2:101-427(+)
MASRVTQLLSKLPVAAVTNAATNVVGKTTPYLLKYGPVVAKELAPPMPSQIPQIQKGVSSLVKSATTLKFLNVSVKEAVQGVLVGVEVACWFYVGEMIGRGSIIGYDV